MAWVCPRASGMNLRLAHTGLSHQRPEAQVRLILMEPPRTLTCKSTRLSVYCWLGRLTDWVTGWAWANGRQHTRQASRARARVGRLRSRKEDLAGGMLWGAVPSKMIAGCLGEVCGCDVKLCQIQGGLGCRAINFVGSGCNSSVLERHWEKLEFHFVPFQPTG